LSLLVFAFSTLHATAKGRISPGQKSRFPNLNYSHLSQDPSNGYSLTDDWEGNNFFNNFDFFTGADPTHGCVQFVDSNTAFNEGLAAVVTNPSWIYMGAEHTKTGGNRQSVRLSSKKSYQRGLFIIDLWHMPNGCATWPAFWMVGPNWPNEGEIDIIEGVNENQNNVLTTLHTSGGCDQSSEPTSAFTGHWATGSQGNPSDNCDINAGDQYSNQGCSIIGAGGTYGSSFNAAGTSGGGVFATQWEASGIYMWYFPRNQIPSDIAKKQPNPAGWGLPYAAFTFGGSCSASHFANQQVIFDLTFCGDWAGSVFGTDCPGKGDCCSFVANNPGAFYDAYWGIYSVTVYQ